MRLFVCKQRLAMTIVSLGVIACSFTAISSASTVAVGNCTNLATYPTLTLAIASVPNNSTIKVCPGVHAEQILITKNLTLTGVSGDGTNGGNVGVNASGADNPILTYPGTATFNATEFRGYQAAALIAVVSPGTSPITVHINNLTIDGSNNNIDSCNLDPVGIYSQNAKLFVAQSAIRNTAPLPPDIGCQTGLGILAETNLAADVTTSIVNTSVHGYAKNGITVKGAHNTATITNNYVVGIGPTTQVAQNGIELGSGPVGKIQGNVVSDDVYINPANCGNSCTGSSGIIIFDTGATSVNRLTVASNTISNTQLPIVIFPSASTADYNDVNSNKITSVVPSGTFLGDAIDLCSNYNTANSNVIYNAAGSGVHIDSTCSEHGGATGLGAQVGKNTINEACAGILTGTANDQVLSLNIFYNVAQTVQSGDSCPAGPARVRTARKAKTSPLR